MRILIVNTSERVGGAAIAASRLMRALRKHGARATMLVRDRQSQQLSVQTVRQSWRLTLKFVWERLLILLGNGLRRKTLWAVDLGCTGTDVTRMAEFRKADVVHLHWVNQSFLSLRDIRRILESGKRVVVTMHDMWYFTAICHYAGECDRYARGGCRRCPLMGGGAPLGQDLARRVFRQKREMYARASVTFVGCSQWIAGLARRSLLAQGQRVVSIPNAIDTEQFCPQDKAAARRAFGLPAGRTLLLFGAQRITDERKGFHLLVEACVRIAAERPGLRAELGIVVVGGDADAARTALPLDVFPAGYVSNEDAMARLYNAVDAYVTPSLQDNLPNTVVEAMACGTPCVGFRVGGIPEMIDHRRNGYVADYRDAADLARGILWAADPGRRAELSAQARRKAVETYSEERVARRYMEVYGGD